MKGIYLETVDSTNDYIKRNADTLSDGDYVYTYSQTAGKGRRGRSWEADGKGLAISIFTKKDAFPELIPLFAAVAVKKAIEKEIKMPLEIKWPNDILLNNKKLCGILCEAATGGYVIGIGVNIEETQDYFSALSLPYATSVLIEGGKIRSREKLAKSIAKTTAKCLKGNLKRTLAEYSKSCVTLGKRVKIISVNEEYEAEVTGLATNGGLFVKTDDGDTKTVISGEVSVRGIYGYI